MSALLYRQLLPTPALYCFEFAHEFCHTLDAGRFQRQFATAGSFSRHRQSLARRKPFRNGFLVYSASHEPLVAKRPSLSCLERLCSVVQRLYGEATRAAGESSSRRNAILRLVPRESRCLAPEFRHARSKYDYRDPSSGPYSMQNHWLGSFDKRPLALG
jgi:hypothetical protein